MDVGKSFTYMFEDKDWLVKIVLGGVFGLLSTFLIGLPFVLGYVLEVINVLIAVILAWVAELLASFGVILCFVGAFLTWFWSMLVGAHLFGQVYRLAQASAPAAPEGT